MHAESALRQTLRDGVHYHLMRAARHRVEELEPQELPEKASSNADVVPGQIKVFHNLDRLNVPGFLTRYRILPNEAASFVVLASSVTVMVINTPPPPPSSCTN